MGGLNLTKFVVNDSALLANIAVPNRAEQVVEITSEVVSKGLGTCWDVTTDSFYYVNRPLVDVVSNVTRRSILKQVSSMYDPLGLITPIVLKGRMIFQAVVRLKLQWDEPVPGPLSDKWLSWLAFFEWTELFEVQLVSGSGKFCWWRGWVDPLLWSQSSQLRSLFVSQHCDTFWFNPCGFDHE